MKALLFSKYAEEAAVIKLILEQAGFIVNSTRNFGQAVDTWSENPYDLVFITLEEEIHEFVELLKQLRAISPAPIMVLANALTDDLHVSLLERGVDMVIDRPFSVRVLLGQVRALLRRTAGMPFFSLPTLTQMDLTLDPSTRTVRVEDSAPKRLTA